MKKLVISLNLFLLLASVSAQIPEPISAGVQMYNGAPTIMLNGQPQNPMIYALTDVPGGRWSWEELPRYNMQSFCYHGFKLVQVDLAFDHVWKEDGTLNLDTAQKQLRGVLDVCPGAAIFMRFRGPQAPKDISR